MVDLVDADGREADGCCEAVAEESAGGVALVGVDELAGDQAVAVEGLAVGEVGVGLTCVGRGVQPAGLRGRGVL